MIFGAQLGTRVYSPCFVIISHGQGTEGSIPHHKCSQVDVSPWDTPMGSSFISTKAAGLPQNWAKPHFPGATNPNPFDQLPQEVTHTHRCSPDGKRAQSWLREVLIPALSCQHSPSDCSEPQDPTVPCPCCHWARCSLGHSGIHFGVQHSALGLCIRTAPGQTRGRRFFLLER